MQTERERISRRSRERREYMRREASRQRDWSLSAANRRSQWMDALIGSLPLIAGAPMDGEQAQKRMSILIQIRKEIERATYPEHRKTSAADVEKTIHMRFAASAALGQIAADCELTQQDPAEVAAQAVRWLDYATEVLPREIGGQDSTDECVASMRYACLAQAMRFEEICRRHARWPASEPSPGQWLLQEARRLAMAWLDIEDMRDIEDQRVEFICAVRASAQTVLDSALMVAQDELAADPGDAMDADIPKDASHPALAEYPRLSRAIREASGGYSLSSDPSIETVMDRIEDMILTSVPEPLLQAGGFLPLDGLRRGVLRRLDTGLAQTWASAVIEAAAFAEQQGAALPNLDEILTELSSEFTQTQIMALHPQIISEHAAKRSDHVQSLIEAIACIDQR